MWGSVVARGLLCLDRAEHAIPDAARFEGAGRLEVFELEEDTTIFCQYKASSHNLCAYQPAALDKALDSTRGVSIQGFACEAGNFTEPIFVGLDCTVSDERAALMSDTVCEVMSASCTGTCWSLCTGSCLHHRQRHFRKQSSSG